MFTIQSKLFGAVPAIALNYKLGDRSIGISIAEEDFKKPELIVAALRNFADYIESDTISQLY